jgi:F-type H+-transporting ATPase subunit delta
MSELATLARPYASAVFKRAKETGTAQQWSEQLAFLSAVLNNQKFFDIANNPKVSTDQISSLLSDICEEQLTPESENFLKLLVQNKRLSLIPDIASIFEVFKADDEGYLDVDVITAYAFTKEAQQDLSSKLEKTLNKKIHMNVSVDKSLIGGVLVRAGDRVIDGSIKGQLQQMRKTLQ